ncbi:MAG TPA: undecaprenyl-phosphate glucose phosphotransferase [Solimonas sp.]|nr:undecaprenyl-phosphate glucose phosphotransferase [Solimonas sp.]
MWTPPTEDAVKVLPDIMPRSAGSPSAMQGLLCAIVVVANLWLIAWAYDVEFSGPYQVLAVLAATFSFLLLGRHDLTAQWNMGRRHSIGTAALSHWLVIVGLLLIVAYLAKVSNYFSRVVFSVWTVTTPLALLGLNTLSRAVALRFVPQSLVRRSAVLALADPSSAVLAAKLQRSPLYELRGYFDDRRAPSPSEPGSGVRHLGDVENLVNYVQNHGIEVVFVMLPDGGVARAASLVDELGDTTASVYVIPQMALYELLDAELSEVEGVPALRIAETPLYGVDGIFKQLLDTVAAFLAMVVLSPLLLLIAVAIKLDSPGPVLYRQRRYGLHGQSFEVYKFRTMIVEDREAELRQVSRNDPRVTRVGRLLRRTSMDELPQLLNVMLGQMSLVGPRPHSVAHNEYYRKSVKRYMMRHKVKPGLTGWAQVHGCRGETAELGRMEDRIRYDLDYIRRWSLWLDIKIILMTLVIILRDRNAY